MQLRRKRREKSNNVSKMRRHFGGVVMAITAAATVLPTALGDLLTSFLLCLAVMFPYFSVILLPHFELIFLISLPARKCLLLFVGFCCCSQFR